MWRVGISFFFVVGVHFLALKTSAKATRRSKRMPCSIRFCGSEGTRDCYHCADTMCTLMRYRWGLIGHTYVFILYALFTYGDENQDVYLVTFTTLLQKNNHWKLKIFSRALYWVVNFIICMIGQKQQWLSGINFKQIKPSTENCDTN